MTYSISSMFGRSPIRSIQEHMESTQQCVVLLGDFLCAAIASDWLKAAQFQQQIRVRENEADDMKRMVRSSLPKSLMLPVARSDLLELLSIQDRLANRSKDIAGLILGRAMEFPLSLQNSIQNLYQMSLRATNQALQAINELDELLEAGFRGRAVDLVEDLILELDRLESRGDALQIDLRESLFKLEADLPSIYVMFLYKIIDLLGEIADDSQKVGSRLLILIAH